MKIRFNSHMAFVFFFILAVIKPVNIENINRYVGMLLMLILCLVFIWSFFSGQSYRHVLQRYLLEIFLIVLFIVINLVALYLNFERFHSIFSFLIYAVASFAVWSAGFMLWYILSQYENNKGEWVGWFLVTLLGLTALWQVLDYTSSKQLTGYFVSADALSAGAISSITRWHTIYGVIAAVGILTALEKLLKGERYLPRQLFFIVLIGLLAYTGIMGESRNFLFTLAIGLAIYLFRYLLLKPKTVLLLMLVTLLAMHVLVIKNDRLTHEYGQVFPYLTKLSQGQVPSLQDLIPQINNHSLTGRIDIWQQGYKLWQQSPWIGIGAGTFRVMNAHDEQHRNLHNYYFQVLVDMGISGLLVLSLLLILLLRRAYQAKNLIILVAILGSLLFDNYMDYSFAWVFIMTWFLFVSKSSKVSDSLLKMR